MDTQDILSVPLEGYIDNSGIIRSCDPPAEDYYGTGSIYGNGPEGEFDALFISALPVVLRKGTKVPNRLLVGFALFDSDRKTALRDKTGERLHAVAVCNISAGTNSKSKPYKIKDAMLAPGELSDIETSRGIPHWNHYAGKMADGSDRFVKVRVRHAITNGRRVSLVSAICRPGTTDQWIEIEGKFEGPTVSVKLSLPFWLNPDGTRKPLAEKALEGRVASSWEKLAWTFWETTREPADAPWRGPNAEFLCLPEEAAKSLSDDFYGRIAYETALIRHRAGLPPTEKKVSK